MTAADAFGSAARLQAEADALGGRLRVCAELSAWLACARWAEPQRRRVRLRGELSVSGVAETPFKL